MEADGRGGRAGHLVAVHREQWPGDEAHAADRPPRHRVRGRRSGSPASSARVTPPSVPASATTGRRVVMLAALRAMQAAGALRDADIEIVLTGDEEGRGQPAVGRARRPHRRRQARRRRARLREPVAQGWPRDGLDRAAFGQHLGAGGARRNSASSSAAMGDGAIFELACHPRVPRRSARTRPHLQRRPRRRRPDRAIRRSANLPRGQRRDNIVPPVAVARGDFRTLTEQTRRVAAKMQSDRRPPPAAHHGTLADRRGLPADAADRGQPRAAGEAPNEVNRDLGLPRMDELDPLGRGVSDIAIVAADSDDGLAGMGDFRRRQPRRGRKRRPRFDPRRSRARDPDATGWRTRRADRRAAARLCLRAPPDP